MSKLKERALYTLDSVGISADTPSHREAREALYERHADKLIVNPDLTRALVSFQANKCEPFYRWLKYKEGFSSELVNYLLEEFRPAQSNSPRVLDPFAGAGTTLTTATRAGWHAMGIELLPVGIAAVRARLAADSADIQAFSAHIQEIESLPFDSSPLDSSPFPHLRITEGAFPLQTEAALSAYRRYVDGIEDNKMRFLFWFACLSILEEISYTRKDGQYLRWDSRSGKGSRHVLKKTIADFRSAILNKLHVMLEDIRNRNGGTFSRNAEIIEGSCLTELPSLPDGYLDLIITSPPYCNRYDYTRTYALELAFMGYGEDAVKDLRQALLSATVENKTKRHQLAKEYRELGQEERYSNALAAFSKQDALHEVLGLLYEARECGKLNNANIPNMVTNYFFEMNLVIRECARVLAPGGFMVMVNDNVQYNGEEIPVDLILSDFATSAGLEVEHIWVLPRGKGNSSQQMGMHGRNEIRKCVYVWFKPR